MKQVAEGRSWVTVEGTTMRAEAPSPWHVLPCPIRLLTNHKKIKDKIIQNSKMAMGEGEWALNLKNEAFLRRGKGVCETVLVTNQ